MSGSGGGSPSETTQTTTSIPAYARPYVEDLLGRADVALRAPYEAYTGERFAQFSPLQQQAFAGAQGLGPAAELGGASALASQAGQRAAGMQSYQPGQFQSGVFGSEQAQQYMSPYMQNVVDIEKREAARQAGIAGTQQQAQATQAGAFGGDRDAIMRAEAARNLAIQQGDIQSRGLQSAFQQAQQQFNADQARAMQAQQMGEQSRQFGAGYGLQGLDAMLRSASTQGQLGAERFRQNLGAIGLQQQLGGQQQQQVQNVLQGRYQDFLEQRGYPLQQFAFMSDLLRGGPLSQSTTQRFQAPPSPLSQAAGLALAGYGLTRAAGGEISSGAGLADLALSQM